MDGTYGAVGVNYVEAMRRGRMCHMKTIHMSRSHTKTAKRDCEAFARIRAGTTHRNRNSRQSALIAVRWRTSFTVV